VPLPDKYRPLPSSPGSQELPVTVRPSQGISPHTARPRPTIPVQPLRSGRAKEPLHLPSGSGSTPAQRLSAPEVISVNLCSGSGVAVATTWASQLQEEYL